MSEPMNPVDAVRSVFQGLSVADGLYTIIAVGGVFLFYTIASRRRSLEKSTFLAVLFWVIAFWGWLFDLYMVTGTKIQGGGPWSWGLLFFAAILLTIAIQFLTRKSRRYEQILSGSAIALIGFGILASFGRGYQPIGFALVMGLVLGLIVGMVISVARALAHSLKDDTEIPREPKEKTRRVTEI